ncbi:hypothetical protein O6H91_12G012800 [Diphasiastrum complanatum]|uniref:Uncharacterized protein n=1 Tax=Diphasiastrum complanatum TaxID=34168 RepID=A0ACC2BYZ3_DIPCM|nr:hypothetical protein O6H91_12G012800 [Diphasiastrum complanatum]
MVMIHVRQSEEQQFLYQCSIQDHVADVIPPLVHIHNLQLLISRLQKAAQQLLAHDHISHLPPSTDKDAGESGTYETAEGLKLDPSREEVRVLLKALAEAGTCASERQVAYKVPLTPYMLEDAIDAIKAAVLRCYPTGLPSDHPLYKELEGVPSNLGLVVDSVQLWWAGKQLQRSRRLCDYTGKNDKTKILVKLL